MLAQPSFPDCTGIVHTKWSLPGRAESSSLPGSAAWAVAGQIAKINGARAVGIAGGERKCALLTDELGFDTAADYRSSS